MLLTNSVNWLINMPAQILGRLHSPLALAARGWVAWQFLKSGWLKATSWDTTLFLFQEEYRVPLVSPELAAVGATAGELVFSVLLILELFGRMSAVGLSAVNVMAVYAYAHVLLGEGFEAALGQHYLWGLMLLIIVVYGPGKLSVDHLLIKMKLSSGTAKLEGGTPALA